MNSLRNFSLRLLFIIGLLVIWEILVRALQIPAFLLPAPSSIGLALYRGIAVRVVGSLQGTQLCRAQSPRSEN